MDAFWHQWLGGLSDGMRSLEPFARDTLLRSCGRACAAPEVLPRMQKLLKEADNIDVFFRSISQRIAGIRVIEVAPELIYDFIYEECGCPLYTEQGLRDSFLCECSCHSLSWVMDELFPKRQPQVTLLESILQGARQCRLRIEFPILPTGSFVCQNTSESAAFAEETLACPTSDAKQHPAEVVPPSR